MEVFTENEKDLQKDQSYQDRFKLLDMPKHYYIEDMYNKQKELQTYLFDKGRTAKFPDSIDSVNQKCVELAIYHSFCMDVECEELKVELYKIKEQQLNHIPMNTNFELIDMFFFLFNVGIYTGIDFNQVSNLLKALDELNNLKHNEITKNSLHEDLGLNLLNEVKTNIINYIDSLPWKAWKSYDLSLNSTNVKVGWYAHAVYNLIIYAKQYLTLTDQDIYSLYVAKWEENKQRQVNKDLGYIR